ncbi:MAG: hypothetical protein WC721_03095 [Victivallaceae bacterium]|jgi:hypothetical protein
MYPQSFHVKLVFQAVKAIFNDRRLDGKALKYAVNPQEFATLA